METDIQGGIFNLGSIFSGFNILNKAIPVRKGLSPANQAYKNEIGNIPISSLKVMRTPLKQYIGTALNVLSLGKWQEAVKKYGYDRVFHLSIVGTLTDGRQFITEKNETVQLRPFKPTDVSSETQTINVPIINTSGLTINQLFDNAERTKADAFWKYDPITNNCQDYVITMLGASHLLNQTLVDFIKQDVAEIQKEIDKRNPLASRIMSGITDLASRFRRITGTGLDEGEDEYGYDDYDNQT